MSEIRLSPMTQEAHTEDALDLANRAGDYVTLETGQVPGPDFVDSFFTDAPPGLTARDLMHFSVMSDPAMVGMLCIAKGFVYENDWWIGLVLLDPAFRGRGIGRDVVRLIREKAKAQEIAALKLSVLEANPRAMHFWIREGFVPELFAPATPDSDGHNRWVLSAVP